MRLAFAGGTSGGSVAFLIFSPRVGSFSASGQHSDCFAADPKLIFSVVSLNVNNQFDLAFTLPLDRSLVGFYFAGQVFRGDLPKLLGSNCASFLVASDLARTAITETFDDTSFQLPSRAPGDWAGSVTGALRPAQVGGLGSLGSFDFRLGTLSGGTYIFDTDRHYFPASATLLGAPVTVTDGRFDFLDFVIPRGVRVRFEGAQAARIHVSGFVRIDGVLDVSAHDVSRPSGGGSVIAGQAGGVAGPGAGKGGAGGDTPAVVGGSLNGQAGEDLQVLASSPHQTAVIGTSGAGSAATPATAAAVTYTFFGTYSNQMAAGGGGGGFTAAGKPGLVIAERAPIGSTGVPGIGGKLLSLLPRRSANSSVEQFLVGGAGGGGGGCHVYDSIKGKAIVWVPGSAGAGGGGALLFSVGGDLTISTSGRIHADGGSAASRTHADGLHRAPGGGGSGGTVLFQVNGRFRNNGLVTAVGGAGGVTEDLRATPGTRVAGGKGAPGFIRVESTSSLALRDLGQMDPAASATYLGKLLDRETVTLAASSWYRIPTGATPSFMGYEVYGVFGTGPVVYSDRRGFGSGPVRQGRTPVTIYTRFARLDTAGEPVPGSTTGWFEGAAIPKTGSDAVQVLFFFDAAILSFAVPLRLETLRLTF